MAVQHFPIEAGHIMCFARAIGDSNPKFDYTDPRTDPVSMIAPPTFVQSSVQYDRSTDLRPIPGQPWRGSGPTDGTAADPGQGPRLHAEQYFDYVRSIRVGDVLLPTAAAPRSWEKRNRHGRLLCFTETVTEYRDHDGELVVTARSVSVLTEAEGRS